jgi:hypothetical protein
VENYFFGFLCKRENRGKTHNGRKKFAQRQIFGREDQSKTICFKDKQKRRAGQGKNALDLLRRVSVGVKQAFQASENPVATSLCRVV